MSDPRLVRFVEYTPEMRARADQRIAERSRRENEEQLRAEYMAAMFRAFRRRLARELPASSLREQIETSLSTHEGEPAESRHDPDDAAARPSRRRRVPDGNPIMLAVVSRHPCDAF